MNQPLVTVIVPVYKVEQYLRHCVQSVIDQTYTNWELILVDDGSPDNCPAICDELAQKDERIRVIHKENGGLSSARNAALDVMEGEYVSFLDSDDFWHLDYLKIMMELLEQYDADIVQCDFVRGTSLTFPEARHVLHTMVFDHHMIFVSQKAKIIVCGKIYKSEFFNDVRMPVGLINEDDWTTWKLYYKAKKIVVTSRPLYYYTYNVGSIMAQSRKKPNLSYFEAYDERIAFFQERGEQDLEDVSRMQLCKSLTLVYANKMLTKEQRSEVLRRFKENWVKIKHSAYVPRKFKCLFAIYDFCPGMASRLAEKLR